MAHFEDTSETPDPTVRVVGVNATGALAYVDGVRVRIRARSAPLTPLWVCDADPSDGRTACEHIAALARTPAPSLPRQEGPPPHEQP